MFRGNFQVGVSVQLAIWTRNAAGTPTLPDIAPTMRIYSASALVLAGKMPIMDRFRVTGFFSYPLYLGKGLWHPGMQRVRYEWIIGGSHYASEDTFQIADGGNDDGIGISSFYYRRAQNSFLLIQGDGGRLVRRRNPSIQQ